MTTIKVMLDIDTIDPVGAGQQIVEKMLMPLIKSIDVDMDAREQVHLWASIMSGLAGCMVAALGPPHALTILEATETIVTELSFGRSGH